MSLPVDFSTLYAVSDPLGTRAFRAEFGASSDAAFAYSRGDSAPQGSVPVSWFMGSKTPGDVIWSSLVAPLVVHSRVVDALVEARITGWSTYAVQVASGAGEPVPGYVGLAIHGRCAARDLSRSEIVLKKYPGGWSPEFRGHFFPPESWDGSDLFMQHACSGSQTSCHRFATDRVRRVLRKAKISNLAFTPLSDVQTMTANFQIGLQDQLPPDFRDRVAAAYASAGVAMPEHVAQRL
jgi:hypothetical protein